MDWIDEENHRRKNGLTRQLTQTEHAMVNHRYQGCTLEYCCNCGDATGKAGKGDGSLYTDDDGPFCYKCFQEEEDL